MANEESVSDLLVKLSQELRRGALVLAALSQLDRARYGYALIASLAERGLDIDQGTLYPLLRRLESQGLLTSEWDVDGSRPRRYYVLSPAGREVLTALTGEWQSLNTVMETLISADDVHGGENESR